MKCPCSNLWLYSYAQTMMTQDENDDTRWTKHDGVSSLAFMPNESITDNRGGLTFSETLEQCASFNLNLIKAQSLSPVPPTWDLVQASSPLVTAGGHLRKLLSTELLASLHPF